MVDLRNGFGHQLGADRTGWNRRGVALTSRAQALLERAHSLLGTGYDDSELDEESPARTAEFVSAMTWLCVERLKADRSSASVVAETCELVMELQQLALELYDHDVSSRVRRVAACDSILAQLREVNTSADLLERACKELVHGCGFGRAVLSRVDDGNWVPWMWHFRDADDAWFQEWVGGATPLDEMVVETQLLNERRPGLVHDTSVGQIHPMITAGRSISYVVAPIMPAGKVVGFVHADHFPARRRCDESDREVLWAFAEGFGHIYERTVLLERLRSQRDEVRDTFSVIESAMAQLSDTEIELAAAADVESGITRTAVAVLTTMSGDVSELTRRESEVLRLLVAGADNRRISEQLVISEATVKSHVKHILRKLGAANRSQAIAHYLGLADR